LEFSAHGLGRVLAQLKGKLQIKYHQPEISTTADIFLLSSLPGLPLFCKAMIAQRFLASSGRYLTPPRCLCSQIPVRNSTTPFPSHRTAFTLRPLSEQGLPDKEVISRLKQALRGT